MEIEGVRTGKWRENVVLAPKEREGSRVLEEDRMVRSEQATRSVM